jgi:hypothetical protein
MLRELLGDQAPHYEVPGHSTYHSYLQQQQQQQQQQGMAAEQHSFSAPSPDTVQHSSGAASIGSGSGCRGEASSESSPLPPPLQRPSSAFSGQQQALSSNPGSSGSGAAAGGSSSVASSSSAQPSGDKSMAKMAHLASELKKEIDSAAKSRRDSNIEIQRLREKCQVLEDRVAHERGKVSSLEERLEKSQMRQRHMGAQLEAMQQALGGGGGGGGGGGTGAGGTQSGAAAAPESLTPLAAGPKPSTQQLVTGLAGANTSPAQQQLSTIMLVNNNSSSKSSGVLDTISLAAGAGGPPMYMKQGGGMAGSQALQRHVSAPVNGGAGQGQGQGQGGSSGSGSAGFTPAFSGYNISSSSNAAIPLTGNIPPPHNNNSGMQQQQQQQQQQFSGISSPFVRTSSNS